MLSIIDVTSEPNSETCLCQSVVILHLSFTISSFWWLHQTHPVQTTIVDFCFITTSDASSHFKTMPYVSTKKFPPQSIFNNDTFSYYSKQVKCRAATVIKLRQSFNIAVTKVSTNSM